MKKILAIVFLITAVYTFGVYVFLVTKPQVLNYEEFSTLPRKKDITLYIKNYDKVQNLSIKIIQNGKEFTVFEGIPTPEVKITLEPKKLGLKEGKGEVLVELKRLFLFKETYRIPTSIDYTPPTVNIIFSPYTVMNGGSGAVRVSVSEDSQLYLKIGNLSFPFYQTGENTYFSLFAVPLNFHSEDSIKIVAVDKVGNETTVLVPCRIKHKRYPVYRIELKGKESKLIPKLSTLLGEPIDRKNLIQAFKKVNEEIRNENEKQISSIGKESENTLYWSGKFLQLRRSKVVSLFGERRIYTYGGKKISESYHWGYDLASVRNAPVEAANSGKVVFAGFLGIYGNTVIIDHGYGLMSLYAHLAEFRVKKGDIVKKGQIIGITDATGLAFGDHLHYGMMIMGVPVNPIEWWDATWIKNNILPALYSRGSK